MQLQRRGATRHKVCAPWSSPASPGPNGNLERLTAAGAIVSPLAFMGASGSRSTSHLAPTSRSGSAPDIRSRVSSSFATGPGSSPRSGSRTTSLQVTRTERRSRATSRQQRTFAFGTQRSPERPNRPTYASRAVRHMGVSRTARFSRVDPVSAPSASVSASGSVSASASGSVSGCLGTRLWLCLGGRCPRRARCPL